MGLRGRLLLLVLLPTIPTLILAVLTSLEERQFGRDKAKKDAADNGGRLCEGQLFYDAAGQGYALVEVPSDANGQKKVLDAMDVTSQHGLLVDADGN